VSEFFNYAVVQKWATENLATKHYIHRPKAARTETKFFTIEQCKKILDCAADAEIGLLPYVALGLFAGLRPEEAERLSWQTDVRVSEQAAAVTTPAHRRPGTPDRCLTADTAGPPARQTGVSESLRHHHHWTRL